MKNKGFFKTAAALLAALVLLGGFSVTAYAGGGEDIPTNDSGVIVETEPQPLTPDGNLSLIDDIEGEAAEDKQFIIVQSKNGNYFYIIVDRAAEGENTVHILSVVCWWLFGVCVISLMILFSTIANSNTGVLVGTGSVVLASYLLGLLPKISKYLPTLLANGNPLIYGVAEAKTYIVAILITVVASLICFAVSIPIFNKKQL